MDGSKDPYADQRNTQAKMWPSASDTVLVGHDWYQEGTPDDFEER